MERVLACADEPFEFGEPESGLWDFRDKSRGDTKARQTGDQRDDDNLVVPMERDIQERARLGADRPADRPLLRDDGPLPGGRLASRCNRRGRLARTRASTSALSCRVIPISAATSSSVGYGVVMMVFIFKQIIHHAR